jgi:hypothetical protein
MPQEIIVSGPLDTRYTAHRDLERRRQEIREWLKERERELGFVKDAPSVSPERSDKK